MDSTYSLNAENYPLYMIAVQDNTGISENPLIIEFTVILVTCCFIIKDIPGL